MDIRKTTMALLATMVVGTAMAQTATWVSSTEGNVWQTQKVKLSAKANGDAMLTVDKDAEGGPAFRHWGVTFNEMCWSALQELTRSEQDEILSNIFSPTGELRITRGRISMGANDYAMSWYSPDEVEGDLQLKYFNIDRDKQAVIPFIRAAQRYNPDLKFWISPWSPPSWMKINGDYPVVSSKYNTLSPQLDYLLFGNSDAEVDEDEMKLTGARDGFFPKQLATTDYMIQDPRYLQAYANCFSRFITAYAGQGIPIDMVCYQNEAYSYTPYPGCAWTAEGTIRFNRDYLAPTLKRYHPEVQIYLGTLNTNRTDHVQKILSDEGLRSVISGVAFQWEGRDVLPTVGKEHPEWSYICSESECGWGSFDWAAAEHTFELINHYLGNGCNEYNMWNCILKDRGESPWGWVQNALIRVDSQTRTFTYTPEYQALKHYTQAIAPGAKVVGYHEGKQSNRPVLVTRATDGSYSVIAGNFTTESQPLSVDIAGKRLSATLAPHSFNTFLIK